MSVRQTFTCSCGQFTLTHDHTALQRILDDEPAVLNGDCPRIPAASVVDGLLLHHLATCAAAQEDLDRRGRSWRRAVTWQTMPRLTGRTPTRRRSA